MSLRNNSDELFPHSSPKKLPESMQVHLRPLTPLLFFDVDQESYLSAEPESDVWLARRHELDHIRQLQRFWPLTFALCFAIVNAPYTAVSSKRKAFGKALDAIIKRFEVCHDILEAEALLQLLTDKSISAQSRINVATRALQIENECYASGLRKILGYQDISVEKVMASVASGHATQAWDRMWTHFCLGPFINNPNLDLTKLWHEWKVVEYLDLAIQSFGEKNERLEDLTKNIPANISNPWMVFYTSILDKFTTTGYHSKLLLPFFPFIGEDVYPCSIPVFLGDGNVLIQPFGSNKVGLTKERQNLDGHLWLCHAAAVSLARGGETPVCPIYDLTNGRRTALCETEPSFKFCSMPHIVGTEKLVDITARGHRCGTFWGIIDQLCIQGFRYMFEKKNIPPTPREYEKIVVAGKLNLKKPSRLPRGYESPKIQNQVQDTIFLYETAVDPSFDLEHARRISVGEFRRIISGLEGPGITYRDRARLLKLFKGYPDASYFWLGALGQEPTSEEAYILQLLERLKTQNLVPAWRKHAGFLVRLPQRYREWKYERIVKNFEKEYAGSVNFALFGPGSTEHANTSHQKSISPVQKELRRCLEGIERMRRSWDESTRGVSPTQVTVVDTRVPYEGGDRNPLGAI